MAIRYVAADGSFDESETRHMVEGGDNTVYAKDYPGYTPDQQSVYVDVNMSGANPASVTFTYTKNELPSATVTVYYFNQNDGAPFYTDTVTLPGGATTVVAPKPELTAGYVAVNDAPVQVKVNQNGEPDVPEITFTYVPEIQQAEIEVYYKDADGHEVATFQVRTLGNGTHTVKAEPDDLMPGYELDGVGEVTVNVVGGVADAGVVNFYYRLTEQSTEVPTEIPTEVPTEVPTEIPTEVPTDVPTEIPTEVPTESPTPEPQPAVVTVYYQNENREYLIAPFSVTLPGGQVSVVVPDASLVPEAYDPASASAVTVEVSAQGVATPAEVVFTFAQKLPVETPIPQGEMINRFGTIVKSKTALRTVPSSSSDKTVVKRLATGTAVYMLRVELNDKGEEWARVLVDGEMYYIKADCIEAMSQADSDRYMASEMATPVPPFTAADVDAADATPVPSDAPTEAPTQEPTAEPTQAPTPTPTEAPTPTLTQAPTNTPEPAQYSGYALTEQTVAIRSQKGGGDSTIVRVADAKELLAVRGQEYLNGEAWSLVTTLDGTEGYVPDSSLRRINNEEAQYYLNLWNDAHATAAPTQAPTDTPVPAQYSGYALTTQAVALRTGISSADEAIIRRMEANELVIVTGQEYDAGSPWSLVTTLDNVPGYVPDSSLRRINNEEAQYYLNLWKEQNATPTPDPATPSPQPAQISGYAVTIGDDVYFRSLPSTMSSIIDVLNKDVVVYVRDQDYQDGVAWHVVQYGTQWGYIRADMLRMMTAQEEQAYLDSLATPAPTLAITPPPYNPDGMSSYGYVSAGSVNFRKEASTSSSRIATLKQYAFCLILGTTKVGNDTWYRISYGGKEGYIHGDYFKQMTIAELEEFLESDEYKQGLTNNSASSGTNQDYTGTGTGGIVPAEDQTVNTWTNPNNGLNVSYEPFDPFATVAPVEPTEAAQPTETVSVEPTATLEPIPTMDVMDPTGGEEQGGGGIIGWMIAVVVILLLGGGIYLYVIYNSNKRKAAQRAAARRAQAAAQQRSEARPYARQGSAPRTGTYPNQAGAQRPQGQPGQARRPGTAQSPYSRPAAGTGSAQQTGYARPGATQQPRPEDSDKPADYTASYRATGDASRPTGRRSAYRAGTQEGQGSYTASYRPQQEARPKAGDNGDFAGDHDRGDF